MKRAILCVLLLTMTAWGGYERPRYSILEWSDVWPLLTEGVAIDIDATSIRFDSTELTGSRTWGDASTDTIVWTWNRQTGTDPTMTITNGAFNFLALQENSQNVPNATDHLGFFAATTSAQLYGVLSDETGSASGTPLAVFNVNPTLTGATMAGILADNDDMVFEVDADNDGSNKYSFTDGAGAEVASLTEAGNLVVTGNVSGATYGSDSSISDAELLTLDNGATTEILVGGGAGSAPVWTTATGTGAPVRAGSPTLTGTPNIGTTAAGGNLNVNATLEAEMSPAPTAADWDSTEWTCGVDTGGWVVNNGVSLVKTASTGTQTATPSGAFSVTAGVKYRVVIVCSAVSGTLTYTLGGVTGTTITATTITDYIIASTTAKIIFSGGAAVTTTITSVSVQALTDVTGDLAVYGDLKTNRIQNLKGTDVVAIGPTGNAGFGISNPAEKMHIANGNLRLDAGRIYVQTGYGLAWTSNGNYNLTYNASGDLIAALSSVGIGTTTAATKLDQAQFSADALGSYHTFSKSRHATVGSHTIVQDNDGPSGIQGAMSDGADFGTIVWRIHGEVDDAAPAASSIGGAVVISTAAGAASDDLTERMRIASNGSVGMTPGTTGGLYKHAMEATAAITANHTITITLSVPSGVKLIGAQLRVDAALAAGETWNAQYVGGATQSIATAQAVAQNTKVNTFFDVNAATDITSDTTNITIQRNSNPGVDAFTAQGTIRAIVYYQAFTTMASI